MHFPDDDERGYDRRYFRGLLAEKLVLEKSRGRIVKRWKNIAPDGRNEPIDLQVYNLACMRSIRPDWSAYESAISGAIGDAKPVSVKKKYGCIRKGVVV